MKASEEFKTGLTPRNFVIVEFKDVYNQECSIQESSAIDDEGEPLLWLGVHENRMHLNVKQCESLITYLLHFINYKDLRFKPFKVYGVNNESK